MTMVTSMSGTPDDVESAATIGHNALVSYTCASPVLSGPCTSPLFAMGTLPASHSGLARITFTLPVVATVPPIVTESIRCAPLSPACSGICTSRPVMYPDRDAEAPVVRPAVPAELVYPTAGVVAVADTAALISSQISHPFPAASGIRAVAAGCPVNVVVANVVIDTDPACQSRSLSSSRPATVDPNWIVCR